MFFENIDIKGFGCLKTSISFVPNQLNLVVADNETGKSTLVSAILAAFYDLTSFAEKNGDKRTIRENVIPWTNPEEFGVVLDFTINSVKWQIERDFNKDTVKLLKRDTNSIRTDQFRKEGGGYKIGEELIGLSCENFLKSFYLRENELFQIRDGGGLTSHIKRVATTFEGGVTSESAIDRLELALNEYPYPGERNGIKIKEAISRYYSKLESIQKELNQNETLLREIRLCCEKLNAIDSESNRLKRHRKKSEYMAILVEINDLQKITKRQEELKEKQNQLEQFVQKNEDLKNFPISESNRLFRLLGSIEKSQETRDKFKKKLDQDVLKPLAKLKEDLQEIDLKIPLNEGKIHEFESVIGVYADRCSRLETARNEVNRISKDLNAKGLNSSRFNKLRNVFADIKVEDRQFIEEFGSIYASEDGKFHEAQARREWIEQEQENIYNRKQQNRSKFRLFFIFASILALAGGALLIVSKGDWLGQVMTGLGLLFGAVGAISKFSSGNSDEVRFMQLEEEDEIAQANEKQAREQLEVIDRRLTELSTKLGFSNSNKFLSVFINFDRVYVITEPLVHAERDFEKAKLEEKSTRNSLLRFLNEASEEVDDKTDFLSLGNKFLNQNQRVLELNNEINRLNEDRKNLNSEIDFIDTELASNTREYETIFEKSGIIDFISKEEATGKFKEKFEEFQKYQSIVFETLPSISKELISNEDLQNKNDRIGRLREKISDSQIMDEIEDINRSKEYHLEQLEKISKRTEQLFEEKKEKLHSISVFYDNYTSERVRLLNKKDRVENELKSARSFKSEVEIALSILKEISHEVYKAWAKALSEDAEQFLKNLNPRYSNLLFEEDLSFSILDKKQKKTLLSTDVETYLSTGAKDEISLAARLGISTFLARGMKYSLPIVLDEPLSAADDEKFVAGMKYFIEKLSRRHQIIVLSCHEARHRWLLRQLPGILAERVYRVKIHNN